MRQRGQPPIRADPSIPPPTYGRQPRPFCGLAPFQGYDPRLAQRIHAEVLAVYVQEETLRPGTALRQR